MSLDKKDFELIEHLMYKSADDIAVSIARSFERLEDRIDAAESRTTICIREIEDKIDKLPALYADTF